MEDIIKKSIFVEATKKYEPYFQIIIERNNFAIPIAPMEYPNSFIIDVPIEDSRIIKTIDTPIPLLSANDEFYFEDTKEIVKIEQVIRTDKDNVVYVINTKYVADEVAEHQYNKDKKAYLDKQMMQDHIDELKDEINQLYNRNLFRRILNVKRNRK